MWVGIAVDGAPFTWRTLTADGEFNGENKKSQPANTRRPSVLIFDATRISKQPDKNKSEHPEPGITGMCQKGDQLPPSGILG